MHAQDRIAHRLEVDLPATPSESPPRNTRSTQPATLDAWRDKVARWVAEGAATGASLLVFPEYAAIEQAAAFGAEVSGNLEATLKAVADLERERVDQHRELAAKHKVHILVGSGPSRKAPGVYVNAAQLVTPAGNVGVQEKRIMTPFERDWGITPGERHPRVRHRARPHRRRHLLRQRVSAARARHG